MRGLVRTQGEVNAGLVARACANAGISDLRLVQPACDIDVKETRMFANKAKPLVLEAPHFASLAEAIADCHLAVATTARQRGDDRAAAVSLGALPAVAAQAGGKVALVFGSEADGLFNDELRCCQRVLTLPMSDQYSCLNLSHAVAVVTHHLFHSTSAMMAFIPGCSR